MRLALVALLAAGCMPRPLPTSVRDVAIDLAAHRERVFGTRVELVAPRFGAPAILAPGEAFVVSFIAAPSAHAHATLARGEERIAVALDDEKQIVLGHDVLHELRATAPLTDGAYDLIVEADGATIERVPKAVYVRSIWPEELSVVQLSDIHLGRPNAAAQIEARLAHILDEVNALRPDLVVVTGDLAEQGHAEALESQAAAALQKLDAPVLVIVGNHDYGHFPKVLRPDEADYGYYQFARWFHGLRRYAVRVGGWDFVGFDSGPSIFSPLVRTRGVDDETLAWIAARIDAATRGVVLFSHAPTRAEVSERTSAQGTEQLGSMARGGAAIEALMKNAKVPIVHLSGHTHWSDAFIAERGGWRRVSFDSLSCPTALGQAALVNAPSATRVSFHVVHHGLDYGFVALRLRRDGAVARFVLYDGQDRAASCLQ
jgi:Icc-related predicted phosphoesterase